MDIIAPVTEVSEELVRESLIAISNLLPDSSFVAKELAPDSLGSISPHNQEVTSPSNHLCDSSSTADPSSFKENCEIEYHRSELISLSYTQPPVAHPLSPPSPSP